MHFKISAYTLKAVKFALCGHFFYFFQNALLLLFYLNESFTDFHSQNVV
jgi:hypothetical protein